MSASPGPGHNNHNIPYIGTPEFNMGWNLPNIYPKILKIGEGGCGQGRRPSEPWPWPKLSQYAPKKILAPCPPASLTSASNVTTAAPFPSVVMERTWTVDAAVLGWPVTDGCGTSNTKETASRTSASKVARRGWTCAGGSQSGREPLERSDRASNPCFIYWCCTGWGPVRFGSQLKRENLGSSPAANLGKVSALRVAKHIRAL